MHADHPANSQNPIRQIVAKSLLIPSNVFPYVVLYEIWDDRIDTLVYFGLMHSDSEPGSWWWSTLNGVKHGLAAMSCPLNGVIPYATLETRDAICRLFSFLCLPRQAKVS